MTQTEIEKSLNDYLGGYARHGSLDRLISYPSWQQMAQAELDRRAASFLTVLPDEELQAIASGQVSLSELAKSITR